MSDSESKPLTEAGLRRVGHVQVVDGLLVEEIAEGSCRRPELAIVPIASQFTSKELAAFARGEAVTRTPEQEARSEVRCDDLKKDLRDFLRPFIGKRVRIMIVETGEVWPRKVDA